MRMHDDPKPIVPQPDPRCVCGKPFLLYIPPGEHVHLCSIHPERAVYGSGAVWKA